MIGFICSLKGNDVLFSTSIKSAHKINVVLIALLKRVVEYSVWLKLEIFHAME